MQQHQRPEVRRTRVGVLGRGRLGTLVAEAVERSDDLERMWSVGTDGLHDGHAPVDVAVDVSHADAVSTHLAWACDTGTDLVVGTTGWDHAPLDRLGPRPGIGVLVAPNFSLTVALLRRISLALGRYAAITAEDADLAVSETHHRRKVDAPSGTALALADALADGAGVARDAIQTTSLRLGAVPGTHTVRLTTASETLTVTHEAHTREVFAQGALAAARWIRGRRGVHTIDDMAEQVLAPLFATRAGTEPAPSQQEEP